MSLKSELSKHLTEEELNTVKTAYDVVGDIAVIEIEENKKELALLIAKSILKINNNVKSVFRKDGGHGGEFRVQNYSYLTGENKTITSHKENGITLKLDINDVYYSPRSSTERKRVFDSIKDNEKILVLFSGCGPFSIGASKNSAASHITSVEMNPRGHEFAKLSSINNKAFNTSFINIDAKKLYADYYSNLIGIKSSINETQLHNKLQLNPKFIELHLETKDLYENKKNLIKTINGLKNRGIEVTLHIPFKTYSDKINDSKKESVMYHLLEKDSDENLNLTIDFAKICKEYNIKGVVHPTTIHDNDRELIPIMYKNIRKLKPYYDYLYFESLGHGLLKTYDDYIMLKKKTNIKNICIDISHFAVAGYKTEEIKKIIINLTKHFNCYFHVNNIKEGVDSWDLEDGELNIKELLPYITTGNIEVRNRDEADPITTKKSFDWLKNQKPIFDRIIMPLPKTSFDFLEEIVKFSKNGTIINFYCFIDEDKITEEENRVKDRLKELGRYIKIIKSTKCGQQSPRCYRVCIDFEFLN